MQKNISLEIKAIENGYIVERSWQQWKDAGETEMDYSYKSKRWMFQTWDDVVKFVEENKLEVPPQG